MSSKPPTDKQSSFADMMKDVTPLRQNRHFGGGTKPPPAARFSSADDHAVLLESMRTELDDIDLETGDDLNYRANGVSPSVIQKLRRGLIRVEGELDLHGMNAAKAKIAVNEFLNRRRQSGQRCVRIIHGKGLRSPNGPVLKRKLDIWLPKRNDVLAYCSARGVDGGTGAIYVLLRKAA